MIHELDAVVPADGAWRPFERGPRELWLRCRGSALAKAVCWIHFRWPWARGQWRFARLLARASWLRSHLYGVRFESADGIAVDLDIPSDQFLFLSGRLSPEPAELTLMRRLVRPGDTFVDVGAHWGLYILHVLGLLGEQGRYVAVEPSRESFRFLRNAYRDQAARVQLVEAAIADYDGDGALVTCGGVQDHLARNAEQDALVVKVMRLDTLLADKPLRGRLVIKVDTEGGEAAVIRGCAGLARAGVRPIFILEFLREMFGQTREDIVGALRDVFGPAYQLVAIDAASGRLSAFERAEEVRGEVHNVLAVPRA